MTIVEKFTKKLKLVVQDIEVKGIILCGKLQSVLQGIKVKGISLCGKVLSLARG